MLVATVGALLIASFLHSFLVERPRQLARVNAPIALANHRPDNPAHNHTNRNPARKAFHRFCNSCLHPRTIGSRLSHARRPKVREPLAARGSFRSMRLLSIWSACTEECFRTRLSVVLLAVSDQPAVNCLNVSLVPLLRVARVTLCDYALLVLRA